MIKLQESSLPSKLHEKGLVLSKRERSSRRRIRKCIRRFFGPAIMIIGGCFFFIGLVVIRNSPTVSRVVTEVRPVTRKVTSVIDESLSKVLELLRQSSTSAARQMEPGFDDVLNRWNNDSQICSGLSPLPSFVYPSDFRYEALHKEIIQKGVLFEDVANPKVSDIGFLSLFTKLAKGEDILVFVFGGSETAGHGCHRPTGEHNIECAWPAQLARWFQQFSAKVKVENRAMPATTTKMLLGLLGSFAAHNPDLIIVDYLVNDAGDDGNSYTTTLVYERLFRTLSELFPRAALMSFEAACGACKILIQSHLSVLKYYGILTVDYTRILVPNNMSWNQLWYPYDEMHPEWSSHVYIADAIAFGIKQKINVACRQVPAILRGGPIQEVPSIYPSFLLNQFPICKKPASLYDAYLVNAITKMASIQPGERHQGAFSFREDRPGKPGWISTAPGSIIKFPISFGDLPTFCISYLRSYHGMANAIVKLASSDCTIKLEGRWRQKNSQLDVTCFHAWKSLDFERDVFFQYMCGFNQKPNTNTTLSLEFEGSAGQQFKVVSVMSC